MQRISRASLAHANGADEHMQTLLAGMQGSVHRKWITSEGDVDAEHTYPNTTRADGWAREWTTLEREMEAHGAKWINILKVGTAVCCFIPSN